MENALYVKRKILVSVLHFVMSAAKTIVTVSLLVSSTQFILNIIVTQSMRLNT